jgi:hypothetical protein
MRTARLLDGFIFAGLLVLIVIVAIPYGTVDAWWEAIFECAIWLFTALWILRVALQGDSQIRRLSFSHSACSNRHLCFRADGHLARVAGAGIHRTLSPTNSDY